jgi:ABC-2 type transport system ATP-binding protein
MNVIQTLNLAKTYGGLVGTKVHALRGVDVHVEQGEAFGLLGPNGAGKTTLVKILLGLVRATGGEAALMGRPVGDPMARLRVGYMPERRTYPEFLTAGQVLDLFGRMLGMDSALRRQRIEQVLEEVEMTNWRDHRVGGFSKGMQQRLALAQALLPDPDVLFLDEPTEGIDPLGRVAIRRILRRNLEQGRSLFVNSHMLTEVEMLCSRVAILVKGKVVRHGPLQELTSPEAQYRITLATEDEDRVRGLMVGIDDAPERMQSAAGISIWKLQVADRDALNAVVDRIRADGVAIEEIQRMRSTLEEVFVETISAASAAGESGADRPGGATQ